MVSRNLRSDQCLHSGISKKDLSFRCKQIKNFHLLQLPSCHKQSSSCKDLFFGTCLICFASFVYSNLLLSLSSIHLSLSVYLSIHSWVHPLIHVVLSCVCLSFHFSHSIQNSDMFALTVSSLMQLHRIHYQIALSPASGPEEKNLPAGVMGNILSYCRC